MTDKQYTAALVSCETMQQLFDLLNIDFDFAIEQEWFLKANTQEFVPITEQELRELMTDKVVILCEERNEPWCSHRVLINGEWELELVNDCY